ncbi:hypothetical protein [Candidatus Nanohalococcus occultus]|uniref:Ion transport domain-containing protein n=1 Tax=Candidatus Nanohalococcus occultus TaxID=2978047 RepID=A0ABY8CEV4_9ARCH|nr:hypothetical protein SVXNc_0729 [Candidatus Nanohaloarchaeota archaeon SVXNc]
MGLTDEYRDAVEETQSRIDASFTKDHASRMKKSLDNVLPLMFLLLGGIIVFSFFVPVSPQMATWVTYANYLVIVYFVARLVVEYRLAVSSEPFFRNHWLDLLMVVPAFSILEEVKLFAVFDELIEFELMPEAATGAAARATGVSARIAKIFRIVKRSIGL